MPSSTSRAGTIRRPASWTWIGTASTPPCCTPRTRCSSGRSTRSLRSTTWSSCWRCQRAYNDWVSEYCAAAPDRLFALGCVPLQDVALAVAEARRIAGLGLRGVMIRPSPYVDELPAEPPRLRLVLDRLPGPRAHRGPAPGRPHRHPGRVPQARPRQDWREHGRGELRGRRGARGICARASRRQRRRHDRVDGTSADGRRLRAVPPAHLRVPRVGGRVVRTTARTHGRAGEDVPTGTAVAVAAAERILPPPVLHQLRAG